MQITLIRHGKVNMRWKKWYTSKQFDMACAGYDASPICPVDVKAEAPTDAVYISTLPRSRQTAEQLFRDCTFVETELLNEVPLRSFCDCRVLLPLWMWNVAGRLQWLWQSKRQEESRIDTQKRANKLINKLLGENRDCILISHGFFMRTLIKELKKQGFAVDKNKIGFANLERIITIKDF